MKSILDVEVSMFANFQAVDKPKTVNLFEWLHSDKYKEQVEQIRLITDKDERAKSKAKLPAITPSGVFSSRHAENLLTHSGLMQFDIDKKDNEHIANYSGLKGIISRISNVAYCGLSVSGQGYWGLIPIAYPEKHVEHFKFMENEFRKLKINIDPAPKNIVSLRYYSYDPTGYFNENALVLIKTFIEKKPAVKNHTKTNYAATDGDKTRQNVEQCINEITRCSIDITDNYLYWRDIGFALANKFGEQGRKYFHDVSQRNSEYDFNETNIKYTNLLKTSKGKHNISTFFFHCSKSGIKFRQAKKSFSFNKGESKK